jgi:hypothetical protein
LDWGEIQFHFRPANGQNVGMNHWPELSGEALAKVEAALARGNKIEAIKIYREATGSGLAEAKAAIERADPQVRDDVVKRTDSNRSLLLLVALILIGAICAAIIMFAR